MSFGAASRRRPRRLRAGPGRLGFFQSRRLGVGLVGGHLAERQPGRLRARGRALDARAGVRFRGTSRSFARKRLCARNSEAGVRARRRSRRRGAPSSRGRRRRRPPPTLCPAPNSERGTRACSSNTGAPTYRSAAVPASASPACGEVLPCCVCADALGARPIGALCGLPGVSIRDERRRHGAVHAARALGGRFLFLSFFADARPAGATQLARPFRRSIAASQNGGGSGNLTDARKVPPPATTGATPDDPRRARRRARARAAASAGPPFRRPCGARAARLRCASSVCVNWPSRRRSRCRQRRGRLGEFRLGGGEHLLLRARDGACRALERLLLARQRLGAKRAPRPARVAQRRAPSASADQPRPPPTPRRRARTRRHSSRRPTPPSPLRARRRCRRHRRRGVRLARARRRIRRGTPSAFRRRRRLRPRDSSASGVPFRASEEATCIASCVAAASRAELLRVIGRRRDAAAVFAASSASAAAASPLPARRRRMS